MTRRTKTVLLATLAVALVGGGVVWYVHHAGNPAEQGYGDIDRDAYESWMQDLGYTE